MPHTTSLFVKAVAEMLGSAIAVFAGAAAAASVGFIQDDDVVFGIAHGLGLMIAVWITTPISGGFVNPLITIVSFFVDLTRLGRSTLPKEESEQFFTGDRWWRMVVFVIAELAGGILAGVFLLAIFGSGSTLGTPVVVFPKYRAFAFEIIGTFIILLVAVLCRQNPRYKAVPVGMTLLFLNLFGRLISGAVFNWARHLGPAVVSNTWNTSTDWIYYAGPAIAVPAAWLVYTIVFLRSNNPQVELTVNPERSAESRTQKMERGYLHHHHHHRQHHRANDLFP